MMNPYYAPNGLFYPPGSGYPGYYPGYPGTDYGAPYMPTGSAPPVGPPSAGNEDPSKSETTGE